MMKQWSGLVYLAIGIAVGAIVGGSLTGLAAGGAQGAGGAQAAGGSGVPDRFEMKAVALDRDGAYVFVLDRQTGTVYSKRRNFSVMWDAWEPTRPRND